MTHKRRETVFQYAISDLPDNAKAFISELTRGLETIPEEYRDAAIIEFELYEYCGDSSLIYWREETPDERYNRLWAEEHAKERKVQARRELYEQLRKEFGDCTCENS